MRFLNPKTDYAFKRIFGSNQSKEILISFLNAILYKEKDTIQDLEILNPYSPGASFTLKDTYLDVKAKLDNNTTVLIEMQVLNQYAFDKRVMYNAAKSFANQLDSGERYILLNPVIVLTIVDFNLFENSPKIINSFIFQEEELEDIQNRSMWLADQEGRLFYAQETARQEGRQEGKEEGLIEGKIELIMTLLNQKLGAIPLEIKQDIQALSADKIDTITASIFNINNWQDLQKLF